MKRSRMDPELRSLVEAQLAREDAARPHQDTHRDIKPAKKGARSSRKPGEMTRVERDYAAHLAMLQAQGEVRHFEYEPLRLVMGNKLTWCPDFAVLTSGAFPRVQLVEVKPRQANGKAYWTEDSRVKVKAAAQMHGVLFDVRAVWPDGRGGWNRETFERRGP